MITAVTKGPSVIGPHINLHTVSIAQELAQFMGVKWFYRISSKHPNTNGTKYLADAAGAYWFMADAASQPYEIGIAD